MYLISRKGGVYIWTIQQTKGYLPSPSMAQRHHQPANQVPDVAEMMLWEREVMIVTLELVLVAKLLP